MSELAKEYKIAQFLAKKMTGELSPEEEQELVKLKKESGSAIVDEQILNPANKRERDELISQFDTNSSLQKVVKRIHPKKQPPRNLVWWGSAAAAVIIIVFTTLILQEPILVVDESLPMAEVQAGSPKAILITPEGKQFNLSGQDSSKTLQLGNGFTAINKGNIVEYTGNSDSLSFQGTQKHVIQIPKGGEYELILPDGTHVWINSDSELSFPTQFDSTRREVFLTGEAYFSVTKDKEKPFIVKVNEDIEIKVLGTQFNVQAYQDENTIETTLCEGSVNVSDGKQKVTLTPSLQAVYSKSTKNLTTRKVDTPLYSSWKDGLFVFENKPLEEIMTTLSRWYNIHVFYANQAVKTYHFTGDLERYGDFRKTLGMIEKATSIRFVINGNNIMVEEVSN